MSTPATKNKKTEAILAGANSGGAGDKVGESIENLSTIANLAKSKKSKSIKPKNSDLLNAKANFGMDFLIFWTKKTFIYLQKAFIEAQIL